LPEFSSVLQTIDAAGVIALISEYLFVNFKV